jgi:hypothetical protein
MDISVDAGTYDQRQLFLTRVLARELRHGLQGAGLSAEVLSETVSNLLFGITAIIDGSRVMEDGDQRVVPVLMFGDEYPPKAVIRNDGTSFMHEYAIGIADEICEAN